MEIIEGRGVNLISYQKKTVNYNLPLGETHEAENIKWPK